ncbi:MAG TPA: nuclear transport factor 2 family protein [Thermoanaerobaculia bacterium]|nr:nuclear transport factor 2 family protein [Thermoanaerobaculia bacterium]
MSRASSEVAEIESVARDYIEGWYTGDVERMDRALHGDLVKRLPVHDDPAGESRLRPVSKARMLELTTEGGGENPDAAFEIFVDDVSADIATGRVVSPEYVDYLHLVRTADGWKIVHVLFRMRD